VVTRSDVETLRARGRQAARRAIAELAPYEALDRIAWASGWVQENLLRAEIEAARAAGIPPGAIAAAAGTTGRPGDAGGAPDPAEPRYRARRRIREGAEPPAAESD